MFRGRESSRSLLLPGQCRDRLDHRLLLLRQIDRGLGLSRTLVKCFDDTRHQVFVDHSVEELLAQRLAGLALGYEDLNDHDTLRLDPLLAVAAGNALRQSDDAPLRAALHVHLTHADAVVRTHVQWALSVPA